MNIRKTSPAQFARRTIAGVSMAICCSLTTLPALAVNQNTVLAELEAAPGNWSQPNVRAWVNDIEQGENQAVALGETVTISVKANTPAHFVMALVDSYGEVKVIRPNGPASDANYQFTAEAPVGQYSLFTFASESEIPNSQLGIPDGQSVYSMDYKMEAVESFVASLKTASGTNPIAKASEYQFSVEDGTLDLQTRGLLKKVSRMQDSKKASRNKPVIVTKNDVAKPAKPIVVVAKKSEEPEKVAVAEPDNVVVAEPEVAATTVIVKEEVSKPVAIAKADLPKIKIIPAKKPDSLSLDIKFELNSANLTQKGVNALDSLGSALLAIQRNGTLPTIMLEGHTDDSGEAAYNLNLSEDRANSARAYLLERFELPKESVQATGLGETTPKTPNTDNTARQINRRVELKVIE